MNVIQLLPPASPLSHVIPVDKFRPNVPFPNMSLKSKYCPLTVPFTVNVLLDHKVIPETSRRFVDELPFITNAVLTVCGDDASLIDAA